MNQRTLARKISCAGIGLHTGASVRMTLHPAPTGTGVIFVRRDLARPVDIPARPDTVVSTRMATTLGRGPAQIGTVEHLLAALYGLGVDNVRVEVDGPEIPVMDGSAAAFVFMIRAAGIRRQRAARPCLRIRKPIELRDGDRSIRIEPAAAFRVSYRVDFPHPAIRHQRLEALAIDDGSFERDIGGARTFGFLRDVESLWQKGLARGASIDNTVVLDEDNVLNAGGLRWSDEFVRHKILDLIGDLALLGMPVTGHVVAVRAGHALHQALVGEVLASPGAAVVVGWSGDGSAVRQTELDAPVLASA